MAEPLVARLDEVAGPAEIERLPYSLRVLLENVLRSAKTGAGDDREVRAILDWQPAEEPHREISFRPARVLLQDFTGVPAIVDLAAMRDAMKRLGGDPGEDQPAAAVELVIDHSVQVDDFGVADRVFNEHRARVRAQPRALRVPPLGPGGLRQLPRRPAGHGDRPPGQPRVPRARRLRGRETAGALPGHARRHRLAHDDGQRPRRPRLGRRRHRGRGGDARAAGVDARPQSSASSSRQAARGCDGDRPRPHRHTDAPQSTASSASSSSSSAPAWPSCRSPTGPRSRTWRPNTARRAASSRSTPRRSTTCAYRPQRRSRSQLVEAYCRPGPVPHAESAEPEYTQVARTRPRHRRAEPRRARAARKTAFRFGDAPRFVPRARCPPSASNAEITTAAVADTFPASDPTVEQAPAAKAPHAPEPERDLGRRRRGLDDFRRGRRSTARPSISGTAPSSSRRSRAARTRPTRPSWSPPASREEGGRAGLDTSSRG